MYATNLLHSFEEAGHALFAAGLVFSFPHLISLESNIGVTKE
jgi:hypothetical protein